MSSVVEIETAVSKLSREELSSFRSWFADFDAKASDNHSDWVTLGAQSLSCAYGDTEPEYSVTDIKPQ